MRNYLLKLLLSLTVFLGLTEVVFADTTMSEEGQYIF